MTRRTPLSLEAHIARTRCYPALNSEYLFDDSTALISTQRHLTGYTCSLTPNSNTTTHHTGRKGLLGGQQPPRERVVRDVNDKIDMAAPSPTKDDSAEAVRDIRQGTCWHQCEQLDPRRK